VNGQQIHPVLSPDIYRRLKAYSAKRGMSLGAIVEEALRRYLDDSGDVALILGRLDRNGRAGERLKRDVELLSEFMSVFVRMWFAHTPQIVDAEREGANRRGAKRFEQMLDFVSKRYGAGHRLTDDLVGDTIADDQELAEAAKKGELG
jgi:predicted DNA-binding protein